MVAPSMARGRSCSGLAISSELRNELGAPGGEGQDHAGQGKAVGPLREELGRIKERFETHLAPAKNEQGEEPKPQAPQS